MRKYGDHDAYGNPDKLINRLIQELDRHGVEVTIEALNSYDLDISIGGHGAACLLRLIEQAPPVTEDEVEDTIQNLVSFP